MKKPWVQLNDLHLQGLVVSDVQKLLSQMSDLILTMQKSLHFGIKPETMEEGVLGTSDSYN